MSVVEIGECHVTLTENEKRVREMIAMGYSLTAISIRLRIEVKDIYDMVHQIKKWEMENMGKITTKQREEIYQRWKNGEKQVDIAYKYGVTAGYISMLIKDMNMNRKAEKPTQSASEKPVEVVEVKQEAAETVTAEPEKAVETVPAAVIDAVKMQISRAGDEIDCNSQRVKELYQRTKQLQELIDELTDWLHAHGTEE